MRSDALNGRWLIPEPRSVDVDPRRRVRCLVVEDYTDLCDIVASLLEHAGVLVRRCASGASVAGDVAQAPPDVVLLDLGLPDKSGLAVARALRDDPSTRHLGLVGFTGLPHREADARRAGFDLLLAKPDDCDVIVDAVRAADHVGRRRRGLLVEPRPSP